MSTPTYKRVSQQDVTGQWQEDSNLLTGVAGRFMSDTQETLAGGVQMGTNVTAEYKTIAVTTPASDWTTMALLNSFTSSVAVSNGFAAPRWRYSANGIQLSGAFEYNAGVGAPAVPSSIALLPTGLVDFNEDSIVWVEGTVVAGVSVGSGLIRLDKNGNLSLRSTEGLSFLTLTFCALDNVCFAAPALALPQTMAPLSCFPITYMTGLPGGQARQVELCHALDSNFRTLSLPQPAWHCDGKGNISIDNQPGLALGQMYQLTYRGMP